MNAVVPAASAGFSVKSFDDAFQLARTMASAKLVPDHLRDDVGSCLLVVEQALRWTMSPFAVAQCTSVIGGKLMFEGKLVAAAVQSCPLLASRLFYEFVGEGGSRSVTVSATIKGEDRPRTLRVTLAEAKTNNAMWTRQPDQQLVYFGTRAWARRYTPEVMLGVYSPEEFDTPPRAHTGPTIDGNVSNQTPPDNVQRTEQTGNLRDAINAETPMPPRRTARQWLDDLRMRVAQCQTSEELDAIATSDDVLKAVKHFQNGAKTELDAIMADAMERLHTAADEEAFPGDAP